MLGVKRKRIKCSFLSISTEQGCDREAVGESYLGGIFKRWIPYCEEHLKISQKAGLPTRLFKDSHIFFCPYCDAQLKPEAIYCSHCGKKIR